MKNSWYFPRKYGLPAVITAEASLLMPAVIVVLVLFLFLLAHAHNRSVLTSAACEQAVSGTERDVTVLFMEDSAVREVSATRTKRTVSYTLKTVPQGASYTWEDRNEASYDIVDPGKILHGLFALKTLRE